METNNKEIDPSVKRFNNSLIYIIALLIFLWISILFSYFEIIWYVERITGLIAYVLFFLTTGVGILRKISNRFAKYLKLHRTFAIWAFIIALAHIISVIFDKVKWGYQLDLLTYLGLNYSNSWFTYTSLGALSFIIFLIVTISSIGKNRKRLGFRLWKNIHYLSYLGFLLIQFHAFNLGTDFKYMSYSWLIYWISSFMIMVILNLLIIRIFVTIKKKIEVEKQETS